MARRASRKNEGRKLSTAAWFGIGCGGVVVLGLIAIGVVWALATGEPPLPPEASATPGADSGGVSQPDSTAQPDASGGPAPSAPSTPSSPSAPPLEQQMQYVQQAERSAQPVYVTMTIRESELNAMLARESTGQVRDLTVYFGNGSIAATGRAEYRGRTMYLTVRGRPIVTDNAVAFDVSEVLIGRLTAPASIHQQVRREFNRGIQHTLRGRKVRVERVQVRPDVMTISGWVGGR